MKKENVKGREPTEVESKCNTQNKTIIHSQCIQKSMHPMNPFAVRKSQQTKPNLHQWGMSDM